MTKPIETSDTPDLIVSVESRKGGVGKTTAALCLGRLLKNKGFAVLVLDLDVTGTNAADIATSPFWENDLHVVRETRKGDGGREGNINFLTLFDQCFMTGNPVPPFSHDSTDAGEMSIDLDRVNVLGSQIYRMDDSNDEKKKNKGLTCLERPNVLFDDLHSLWLLNFIQQLIGDFCHVARNRSSSKVAIILDNSPGYVGIAPKIHDWLTDCGPVVGKFLTVASLDGQDIIACNQAVKRLHNTYRTKWEISRLFATAGKGGGKLSVPKDQEAFFMRLATSASGVGAPDSLTFFRCKTPSTKSPDGKVFIDSRWKYIGLVINRVPRAVKTQKGELMYEFSDVPELSCCLGEKTASRFEKRWQEHMIVYDEYIENQFLERFLTRRHFNPRTEQRLHRLSNALARRSKLLHMERSRNPDIVTLLQKDPNFNSERLRAQIIRCNEAVSGACSNLDDAGMGHLARLIHSEWLPGSIITTFKRAFTTLLNESKISYFDLDMTPFELETGPVNPDARKFVNDLKMHIIKEMREFEPHFPDSNETITAALAGVLSTLVGLSLTSPMWHQPIGGELVSLFAGVLSLELRHWEQKCNKENKRYTIEQFLAAESAESIGIKEKLIISEGSRFFRWRMPGNSESSFANFYAACTSAQARLIDLYADSQFLVDLMRFMAEEEMKKGRLFPFIRGLAEEVIERKTTTHTKASIKMVKSLQAVEYFRDFDQVLVKITNDWGVPNA